MSYNIRAFSIYKNGKKIRLSGEVKELVESGYYPPYYMDNFDKWIAEKSKNCKLVVYHDGDYGQFADVYENGKKIREIDISKQNKNFLRTL